MLSNILVVVAMQKEAIFFINDMHLHKMGFLEKGFPVVWYHGKINGKEINLLTNGESDKFHLDNVGTQPATLTTTLGIIKFHPNLIISAGSAGGSENNNAYIGDIFLSKSIDFFSRRIPGTYFKYGYGSYESFVVPNEIVKKYKLKIGINCSGDSFDENNTDIEQFKELKCSVKEMEAAGVAWVSSTTNTPMFSLKGITDNIDSNSSSSQYKENFTKVLSKLSIKLKDIIISI